jgi:hypothetical protein
MMAIETPAFGHAAYSAFPVVPSQDMDHRGFHPSKDATVPSAAQVSGTGNPITDPSTDFDMSMDAFMNLIDDNGDIPSRQQSLVVLDHDAAADRPASPADEEILMTYQKMSSFCVSPACRLPQRITSNIVGQH